MTVPKTKKDVNIVRSLAVKHVCSIQNTCNYAVQMTDMNLTIRIQHTILEYLTLIV
jgi:hypothetical protein